MRTSSASAARCGPKRCPPCAAVHFEPRTAPAPRWPNSGAALTAEVGRGRIRFDVGRAYPRSRPRSHCQRSYTAMSSCARRHAPWRDRPLPHYASVRAATPRSSTRMFWAARRIPMRCKPTTGAASAACAQRRWSSPCRRAAATDRGHCPHRSRTFVRKRLSLRRLAMQHDLIPELHAEPGAIDRRRACRLPAPPPDLRPGLDAQDRAAPATVAAAMPMAKAVRPWTLRHRAQVVAGWPAPRDSRAAPNRSAHAPAQRQVGQRGGETKGRPPRSADPRHAAERRRRRAVQHQQIEIPAQMQPMISRHPQPAAENTDGSLPAHTPSQRRQLHPEQGQRRGSFTLDLPRFR